MVKQQCGYLNVCVYYSTSMENNYFYFWAKKVTPDLFSTQVQKNWHQRNSHGRRVHYAITNLVTMAQMSRRMCPGLLNQSLGASVCSQLLFINRRRLIRLHV